MNVILEPLNNADMFSQLLPVVVGGLIAAITGAMTAFGTGTWERLTDRKIQQESASYSIFAKLLMITNSVGTLQQLVDKMISQPGDAPDSEKLSVIVGLDDSELVEFSTDELTFCISEKKEDLFNDLQLLSRLQHSLFTKIHRFNDLKIETRFFAEERAEISKDANGRIVQRFAPSDGIIFKMKNESLEPIAQSIIQQIPETIEISDRCIDSFQKNMGKYFDSGKTPQIEPANLNEQ